MLFQLSYQGKILTRVMQWPHNHCIVNSIFLIDSYNGSAMPLKNHCNNFIKLLQWPHKNKTIARAERAALHIAPG